MSDYWYIKFQMAKKTKDWKYTLDYEIMGKCFYWASCWNKIQNMTGYIFMTNDPIDIFVHRHKRFSCKDEISSTKCSDMGFSYIFQSCLGYEKSFCNIHDKLHLPLITLCCNFASLQNCIEANTVFFYIYWGTTYAQFL